MAVSPEIYLISSVLRDQDVTTAIKHGVSRDMFRSYPEEWEWIEDYWQRYRKTPSKNAFKTAFASFPLKAVNDTGHFSEEVRKSHARFGLLASVSEVTNLVKDGDLEGAIAMMHRNIITVAAGMGTVNDEDIITNWEEVYNEVARRHEKVRKGGMAGIRTGFDTLDDRTGGMNPGDLVIVGARLGEGKSWTMQRMATTAVMDGCSVQFDALEQSRVQVEMRVHAFLSSAVGKEIFSSSQLMQGKDFNLKAYRNFLSKMKDSIKGRLHVSDTSRGKVSTLTVASQIERNHPDIVFIDYITLMAKGGTDWQHVAAISGELKQISMSYQVPIVAAAQLNRANGLGKEPAGPEALAQADAIGQDADMVITSRQQSPSVLKYLMAKHRNGAGGFAWYVQFQPNKGIMKEVTYSKAQELKDADADERDAEQEKVKL